MKTIERDVIIIGAGISGCSTAIRLLQEGKTPLIIDKALFPRETVGEGLSPAIGEYIKELGVLDEVLNSEYVEKKVSFQIVSPSAFLGYTKVDFEKKHYKDGLHNFPCGFNVRRKYFDFIFFNKAKELGAEIWQETTVTKILIENEVVVGVFAKNKDGQEFEIRSKLLIDCSGRVSVLANQLKLRQELENVFEGQWSNFAIRCHFTNVNMKPLIKDNKDYHPATVNILPFDDCWFWFIPLDTKLGLISIGFVARSKMKKYVDSTSDKKQAYLELIKKHPVLNEVVKDAEMSDDIIATSRLGHMNSRMSGAGFLCVGDAAFFADPAWGTGVTISFRTSKFAAETAIKALNKNDFSSEGLNDYQEKCMEFINDPFNSIRAYNYYYNDSEYIDYIVERLSGNPEEMDMVGAVLFDYTPHEEFQKWSFNQFKNFVVDRGRLPILNRMSQFDFDQGKINQEMHQ